MKFTWYGATALAASLVSLSAVANDDPCKEGSSLRLVNGKIHTLDSADRVVSSVLIRNGRFAAVGHDGYPGNDQCTQVINLRGRTVVPGIIDNHNHIVLLGLRPGHDTRIENARSIAEVQATFAARAREIPAGEWLTALGGFNVSQFTPPPAAPRMPTLAELDAVTPNHPVLVMQGFNGPTVTNSLGAKFFGTLTPAVPVDLSTGAIPTGGQSIRALNALRGLQTFTEQKRGLGYAMTYAAEVGVTTHLDQGGFPNTGQPNSDNSVDALANFDRYRAYDSLRALYHEGKIFNRIWINFLHMEADPATPELNARLLNVFNDFGDDTVRILGIGEFTGGGLFPTGDAWRNGTRLVALAQWRNENHSLGFNVGGVPDWKIVIDGWQSVHIEIVADTDLGLPDGITKLRWVLAHVPFIDTEYLNKLKALGGGISLVGGWRYISGSAAANGPPFRLIIDNGIRAGMSSDGMQISPMNPWLGMYYAVTGRNARGDLINAGQTTTRKEILRLYTAANDWFLKQDGKVGTIEEGRFGDLIVLSDDYFDPKKVSDEGIKDIYSVLTVVNGKVVHDNLDGRKPMYWNRDFRRQLGLN